MSCQQLVSAAATVAGVETRLNTIRPQLPTTQHGSYNPAVVSHLRELLQPVVEWEVDRHQPGWVHIETRETELLKRGEVYERGNRQESIHLLKHFH